MRCRMSEIQNKATTRAGDVVKPPVAPPPLLLPVLPLPLGQDGEHGRVWAIGGGGGVLVAQCR